MIYDLAFPAQLLVLFCSRVTAIHLRLQIVGGDITHEETLKRKVHYYKFKGLNPNTRYVLSLQTANKRGILSTPVSSEITTGNKSIVNYLNVPIRILIYSASLLIAFVFVCKGLPTAHDPR